MPRGYWRIILPAIGFLIVAGLGYGTYQLYKASEQQRAGYDYQPASKPGFVQFVPSKTVPPGYKPHCKNPQFDKDAELCAQWAAVEQAGEANRMASLNLRFALVSLWATIIATIALVWTLIETREVSRRQLRAYVTVEPMGVIDDDGVGKIVMLVKNWGQTPAYFVNILSWIDLSTNPAFFEWSIGEDDVEASLESETTLGPGQEMHTYGTIKRKLTRLQERRIRDKKLAIVSFGIIHYRDAFGRPQHTDFTHYHWGKELNLGEAKRSRLGNSAT